VNQLMQGLRSDSPEPFGIDVCDKLLTWRDLLLRSVGEDIDLSLDVQNARACVYCDDVQLQAAVLNLLSNARQAMQNVGWVRISTHVEQRSNDALAEGRYLVLSVADGGPGMGKQIARKALDPFFTTKASGAGTGLGLAQVQDFAAGAGGGVQIDTSPGKGTTVRMYLRILDAVPVSSASSLKVGAK
jgi:signal transduction histidine kinase